MTRLHPNDVWVGYYFTSKLKELVHRCGYFNPTRCIGQGKRDEGISRMVNSKEGIPLCESMRAARYDSVDAHFGYTEPNNEAHDIFIVQVRRMRLQNAMTIAR